jgi:FdhE protein
MAQHSGPPAESRFQARIDRARHLAAVRPAARQSLEFLASLTELQQSLARRHADAQSALAELTEWLRLHDPGSLVDDVGGRHSPAIEFLNEVLLQAFTPDPCPDCGGPPVVALVREPGSDARRSHVCGSCLRESPAPRPGCAACGEQRTEKLPGYRTDELDPARIDACDTCRVYLKTIDLTRDGQACPVADDVASLPLDLWARQRGYRRSRPGLLRL